MAVMGRKAEGWPVEVVGIEGLNVHQTTHPFELYPGNLARHI